MVKRRIKRFSGSLDRYLLNPSKEGQVDLKQKENLKVINPLAEFETEEKEKQKQFIPQASHLKPEPEKAQSQLIELPPDMPIGTSEISEENTSPLFCNYCDVQKQCPDGRGVIRKDQTKLIVCKRRTEFRRLISEAGTTDRQGLIAYVHKLRNINSVRIGQMIYKEALQNKGQDRNLSLLIDKQIDNALAEYRLLLPQDKNINKFSFHLTQVHNSVDTFNELPVEIKSYLLLALKTKLNQIKNPTKIINPNNINNDFIPDNNNTSINIDHIPLPNPQGGQGGDVVGSTESEASEL